MGKDVNSLKDLEKMLDTLQQEKTREEKTEKARKIGMAKIQEIMGDDKWWGSSGEESGEDDSGSGSGSGSGGWGNWLWDLIDYLFWDLCDGDEDCFDSFWYDWGSGSGSGSGSWSGSGSGESGEGSADWWWWWKKTAEQKPGSGSG